jgi:hypothetical protein
MNVNARPTQWRERMNLTPDTEKQIAIRGADVLGMEITNMHPNMQIVLAVFDGETMPREFSPCSDANAMNMLIEHFKIEVYWLAGNELWCAKPNHNDVLHKDKYRDTAIKLCVMKCLRIKGPDNE